MVLYTINNLLPIKDILKTLPSSGINKCQLKTNASFKCVTSNL